MYNTDFQSSRRACGRGVSAGISLRASSFRSEAPEWWLNSQEKRVEDTFFPVDDTPTEGSMSEGREYYEDIADLYDADWSTDEEESDQQLEEDEDADGDVFRWNFPHYNGDVFSETKDLPAPTVVYIDKTPKLWSPESRLWRRRALGRFLRSLVSFRFRSALCAILDYWDGVPQ